MTHPLALLAAFVLGVLATARLTRLVVHDKWPPMLHLRLWWIALQERRNHEHREAHPDWHILDPRQMLYGWRGLLDCPYCFAPYAAALVLAGAIAADVWSPDLGTLRDWWLVLAVWAAGSYLASMVVVYDEPSLVEA